MSKPRLARGNTTYRQLGRDWMSASRVTPLAPRTHGMRIRAYFSRRSSVQRPRPWPHHCHQLKPRAVIASRLQCSHFDITFPSLWRDYALTRGSGKKRVWTPSTGDAIVPRLTQHYRLATLDAERGAVSVRFLGHRRVSADFFAKVPRGVTCGW